MPLTRSVVLAVSAARIAIIGSHSPRFSVDAVLASLRARPGETPADLKAGVPLPDPRPVESLAVLGLLLQIAAIYWFNFVHKSGTTWRTGTAIYYVLHQERIVTGLAVWLRDHLPFAAMKVSSAPWWLGQ